MQRTTTTPNRRGRRRAVLVVACLVGLAPLGGGHLALGDTGLKFVCDGYDYNYVQDLWGGYYIPVNDVVGASPGINAPGINGK